MDKRNASGRKDLTAYTAGKRLDEEKEKISVLANSFRDLARLAGYEIDGRIVFVDVKTGRVWK